MAIRQYIGARYVTKIYENSIDPSSAEWEANVNYEPLVMVTYNNGSYLSRKTVPASIGDPPSNPSYWAQTGFYNGQIVSLQQQIIDLRKRPPMNALELGMKNDGSEDISTIFNAETANYDIFFPSGTYRVDDTLLPKKAIIGEVETNLNTSGVLFVSNISDKTKPVIKAEDGVVTLSNFALDAADNGEAILFEPTSAWPRLNIYNLQCRNFDLNGLHAKTSAIAVNPRIEVNNLHLLGNNDVQNIGVLLESKFYDSYFNDVQIQFCERGVVSAAGYTMWNGLNVYCGGTNGAHTYADTIGVHAVNSPIVISNCYIDTCYIGFQTSGSGVISADGVFVYFDDSVNVDSYISGANVKINSGLIYGKGLALIVPGIKAKTFCDAPLSSYNKHSNDYMCEYQISGLDTTRFTAIAIVHGDYGAFSAEIMIGYNHVTIDVVWQGGTINVTAKNLNSQTVTDKFGYKVVGDMLYIYAKSGGFASVKYTSPSLRAINYDLAYKSNGAHIDLPTESAISDITPITFS